MLNRKFNALPGFRVTLGFTLFYLSLIVLIPMGALFLRVFEATTASATFTPKDFQDLPAFVTTIKEHTTPAAKLVWDRFPDALRQQMSSADGTNQAGQQAFLAGLNTLLHGPSLYDTNVFSPAELGAKSHWYVEHGSKSAWFNRSLLEDAFSLEVNKKHNSLSLWLAVSDTRALAAYKLTFGASVIAALINAIFGTILAWVLVRYQFPGKRFIDALVDFPFALPTAVAGLTLANLFAKNGWLGKYLVPLGIEGTFTPLGVIIALTFVGMPFAVRTLQPVLEHLDRSLEEAAATLGAGRWRTFLFVIGPMLAPTVITGFALSFARAVGEYGSIVFISGSKAYKTEIAPQLIVFRLDEYDFVGATAIASVLLVISFLILICINYLEGWANKFTK
jgi:sulfate/thiosulfate transport system permease protein